MFWKLLIGLAYSLRMTAFFPTEAPARSPAYCSLAFINFIGLYSQSQMWFPPHMHICPSYFGIASQFRQNNCKFLSQHRFILIKFLSSSLLWASCQLIPSASLKEISQQWKILSLWKRNKNCFLISAPSASQFSLHRDIL